MEDLVFSCFNREASQVKAFVVAGGGLHTVEYCDLKSVFVFLSVVLGHHRSPCQVTVMFECFVRSC